LWELVFVLGAILVVLLFLRGSPELARLEVRDGKVSFLRGRMPSKLVDDFADILSHRSIQRADVRIVLEGGVPRVVAEGLSDDRLQQLRNVTGSYSTAQFRSGRAARQ
jgi:hypothetical protein